MVVDSIVEDTTPTSSQEASAAFHDGCSDSKEIDSKPSGADGRFHKVLSHDPNVCSVARPLPLFFPWQTPHRLRRVLWRQEFSYTFQGVSFGNETQHRTWASSVRRGTSADRSRK